MNKQTKEQKQLIRDLIKIVSSEEHVEVRRVQSSIDSEWVTLYFDRFHLQTKSYDLNQVKVSFGEDDLSLFSPELNRQCVLLSHRSIVEQIKQKENRKNCFLERINSAAKSIKS